MKFLAWGLFSVAGLINQAFGTTASVSKQASGYICEFGDMSGNFLAVSKVNSDVEVAISSDKSLRLQRKANQVDPLSDYFAKDWANSGYKLEVFKVQSGTETLFRGVIRIIIAVDEKVGKHIYGVFLVSEERPDAKTGKVEENLFGPPTDLLCKLVE